MIFQSTADNNNFSSPPYYYYGFGWRLLSNGFEQWLAPLISSKIRSIIDGDEQSFIATYTRVYADYDSLLDKGLMGYYFVRVSSINFTPQGSTPQPIPVTPVLPPIKGPIIIIPVPPSSTPQVIPSNPQSPINPIPQGKSPPQPQPSIPSGNGNPVGLPSGVNSGIPSSSTSNNANTSNLTSTNLNTNNLNFLQNQVNNANQSYYQRLLAQNIGNAQLTGNQTNTQVSPQTTITVNNPTTSNIATNNQTIPVTNTQTANQTTPQLQLSTIPSSLTSVAHAVNLQNATTAVPTAFVPNPTRQPSTTPNISPAVPQIIPQRKKKNPLVIPAVPNPTPIYPSPQPTTPIPSSPPPPNNPVYPRPIHPPNFSPNPNINPVIQPKPFNPNMPSALPFRNLPSVDPNPLNPKYPILKPQVNPFKLPEGMRVVTGFGSSNPTSGGNVIPFPNSNPSNNPNTIPVNTNNPNVVPIQQPTPVTQTSPPTQCQQMQQCVGNAVSQNPQSSCQWQPGQPQRVMASQTRQEIGLTGANTVLGTITNVQLVGISGTITTISTAVTEGFAKVMTAVGVAQAGIATLGGQIAGFAKSIHLDKVLNFMTFILTLHNALQLSRSLASSIGELMDSVLARFNLKDENGDPLNISTVIGGTITDTFKAIVGEELFNNVTRAWAKGSAIWTSAVNIMDLTRNMLEGTQTLVEIGAQTSGKIGNALKKAGVVMEDAFDWFDEKINARTGWFAKFRDFVDGVQEPVDTMLEISETINEIGENWNEILAEKENITQQLETNIQEKTDKETANKTNSESPNIENSDLNKPED